MTLVDTSSWIEQLRKGGDDTVRERVEILIRTGEAAWCPIVRLELWNGVKGEHERKILEEMESILTSFDITREVWKRAINLSRLSRESGITVPATDILVAACAEYHGIPLEHHDSHFDLIETIATD